MYQTPQVPGDGLAGTTKQISPCSLIHLFIIHSLAEVPAHAGHYYLSCQGHGGRGGGYTRHCSYSLDDQGLAEVLLCVHKQELLSGQVLHNQLHLT